MVFNLEVDDSKALLDESAISDEINTTTVKKEEGTILFKMPGKNNDLSIQEEECV